MSGKAADEAPWQVRRREHYKRRRETLSGRISIGRGERDWEPLRKYFRLGPHPLSLEDWEALTDLIEESVIPRIGRPKGSVSPVNFAVACASYIFRVGKEIWCAKHRRARATPKSAPLDRMIQRAIELVERDQPDVRGKITASAVREFKSKPTRDVIHYVMEFLPESRREMYRVALQQK